MRPSRLSPRPFATFPSRGGCGTGLGSAYYLTGRNEDAAVALLEAIKLDPAAKVAYYLLGKAYEAAGSRQADIRAAFKAYLEKEPRDPWAYYHYGSMLYLEAQTELTPDFKAAKAYLGKALALNPDFAEAHLQMGIIEQAEGRLPEAVRSLERAIRINPDLPAPHYRLGQVYQRLGDKERSKAEFDLFEKLKAGGAASREAGSRPFAERAEEIGSALLHFRVTVFMICTSAFRSSSSS